MCRLLWVKVKPCVPVDNPSQRTQKSKLISGSDHDVAFQRIYIYIYIYIYKASCVGNQGLGVSDFV
jgi:hypothetical protein